MVIDEVSDRRKQFSLAPVGDDLGTRHRNKICETVIILIPLCSGRYVCTRNAHAHAQSDAIAPCDVTVLIGRALCRMIQSRYIPAGQIAVHRWDQYAEQSSGQGKSSDLSNGP